MNRSFSKIRHIQEVNKKLEERRLSLLSEQDISGYEGSKTDPSDMEDTDMSNIKVTKYDDEIERKPMSVSDPNYDKIKKFFELEYDIEVLDILEPVKKGIEPLVYEVHFPSTNPNEKFKVFEFTIEDIEKNDPTFAKRLRVFLPSIKRGTMKNNLQTKPEKTYRA
jgi:hypothetical protein